MADVSEQLTQLLREASLGRQDAWHKLTPIIYPELKKLAEAAMLRERSGHTLQPTALVNEAFIRLAASEQGSWKCRTHFYGAAAEAMRRVLVDHARKRKAIKRGGGEPAGELEETLVYFEERSTDVLTLDEALKRLAELDRQQSRIVEMRFFGGLTVPEVAALLGTSASTVERGWRLARAWLLREVGG